MFSSTNINNCGKIGYHCLTPLSILNLLVLQCSVIQEVTFLGRSLVAGYIFHLLYSPLVYYDCLFFCFIKCFFVIYKCCFYAFRLTFFYQYLTNLLVTVCIISLVESCLLSDWYESNLLFSLFSIICVKSL